MKKVRLPIRFNALRAKVMISLVIATSVIALVGIYRITNVCAQKQQQQLQTRAKTLADAVVYLASTAQSPEELQRFVVAGAHTADVGRITVTTRDHSTLVADSSRSSDKPNPIVTAEQRAPALIQEWGQWQPGRQHYDWFAPTMVPLRQGTKNVYVPGTVRITFDTRTLAQDNRTISFGISLMMTALLGLMGLVAYRLLYWWVLFPARDIANVLERRAAGDLTAYAKVHSDDELGQVAASLNSLLMTLDVKEAERCAAVDSLHVSESLTKKLSMVASRTDNGVIITDRTGHVEWVNEGFTRISGYTLAEMQGRRPGTILQGNDTNRNTIQFMRERLSSGEPFSTEIVNYHKNGHSYWVSIDVQPVHDDAGNLTHFVAIQRDITTRKEAQAEQQKFVSLVENSSDFIAMTNLDGQFTYVNPAGCRLVGLTGLAQAIRSKLTDLVNAETADYLNTQAIATAQATGYWTGELVFRRFVANERIDMQTTIFLVRDAQSGQAICLAVVGRDVTERKRAEVTLLRSHQEIAAARVMLEHQTKALQVQNEELRVAHEKAEAAVQAKSAFLANMSHEIRTPMTAILGFADMLLSNIKDPDAIDALQTIHRNGEHLLAIINDILDISKIEANRMQVEQIAFDPIGLLDEVLALMRGRAHEKGLDCQRRTDTPIPATIVSDPTRLRQILINLIGNAIKFTETGKVEVRVGIEAGTGPQPRMFFDIVDTGIGLDERQINLLFQPFVQADNSMTRRFGGTGLGLTISQRFACMLGGEITVTSQPGKGSSFRVIIAIGTPEASGSDTQGLSKRDARSATPTPTNQCLAGASLLLAEDGVDNQRILSFLLGKAGAAVTVVENGKLAVDQVQSGVHFDAILLDMQMPVMDGYEAARSLRSGGYTGPIIALTAHAMRGDREKCLAAGCDDYATKPVDRVSLLALLEAQLQRQAAPV